MKRLFIILVLLVFDLTVFSQQSSLTPKHLSEAKYVNYFTKIPAPSIYLDHNSLSKVQTLNISANFEGAWPSEAQNAFNYALKIWSYLINSTIPIKIKAEWVPLEGGALAETYAITYKNNFLNAPIADVNFPVSLAEALSGIELNGTDEEISIKVNSDFSNSWYYGVDGSTPSEKFDLVTVVLHEVAHGLGFSHSMMVENNIGSWGQNYPQGFINYYENFGVVGPNSTSTYRLTNTNQYPNPSGELANALQSDNLYFDGPVTKQMFLNNLPKIYAPNPFEGGSTLAHFDEDAFPAGNQNSLLSPKIGMAESIHSPGELGLAVLKDLGWTVNRLITILEPTPGLAYMPGQSKEIKWIDNIGGAISIDLLKKDSFGDYQYYSTIASHPSPLGSINSINWTIPNVEGTFKIRMIDNTFSGEGFGLSYPFIISTQAQVATPIILPLGSNYLTAQTITISCATPDATIYYTTDNTDPSSSNGTEYESSFSINSDMVIKAIAVKSGFPDSEINSETYTFGTMPQPATITPISGQYPVPLSIVVNWPSDVEGYVAWTNNGSEPIDPKVAGWNIPNNRPWSMLCSYVEIIKINARTKKNGVWGPLVQRTYDLKPSLRIAQVDDEITQGINSFGFWNKWVNNQWSSHPDETIVRPTQTSDWYLKALQDFKDPANNIFRKYNVWSNNLGANYFVNHARIPIGSNTSSVLAHFKQTYDVTVTNKLDNSFSVNRGNFIFKNPWIVDDYSDNERGPRNRGDGTVKPLLPYTINFSTSPNITAGSIHKGVFLNQNPQFQTGLPVYSVKADAVQDIPLSQTGKTHRIYFQNWTGTDVNYKFPAALETPVVFLSDNSIAEAVYKGTQLSNTTAAYSNNSQRKFLKQIDGTSYNLYQSMNRIWLEKSTDNGYTWVIANHGKPIVNFDSKNPSMCLRMGALYIVFESEGNIYLYNYYPDLDQAYLRVEFQSYTYGYDTNPVVTDCFQQDQWEAGPIVIWKAYCNDGFSDNPGLYYAHINSDNYTVVTIDRVPNTGTNSYTPSIAGNDPIHDNVLWKHSPMVFNLVWEERGATNYSSIMYYQCQLYDGILYFYDEPVNISYGSGYTYNSNPSLITIKDENDSFTSRVVWRGSRMTMQAEERLELPISVNLVRNYEYKTIYKDLSSGTRKIYGTKTNLPTISKLNNNSEFYFAYSEQSNQEGKVIFGHDLSQINGLEASGKDVQIGNGNSEAEVKANLFKSNAIPYYFNLSASMNHVVPKKNIMAVQSGREGVVFKDTAQFYFAVGDVFVDNQPVQFKFLPDSIQTNTRSLVNEYLETESFTLSDNSVFYYSVQYGITDSLTAVQLLSGSSNINFKVDLLEASSGAIIGTFDNVLYSQDSVYLYNNIAYQVNTAGIGNTQVKLRLVINTTGEFEYSLSERFAEESVLGKSTIKQINLDGSGLVKEYALAQNFPNPFNPSTTILYQLPKAGMVTLKIYDILGSEVATLVNEEKLAGRYEVNFNASSLASGVYIYRISSGSFTSSKKLMLIK